MEFLGIGPLELAFIVLIILLVVGPRDVTKTARGVGRAIHSIAKSEAWQTISLASRELRTLPARLAREAELEELKKIKSEASVRIDPPMAAWTKDGKPAPAPRPPSEGPAPEPPSPEPETKDA